MDHQYYQICVKLRMVVPQPWRRLIVRSDSTFHELHHIIQIAFGWENRFLYEFHYEGYHLSIPFYKDKEFHKELISSREVELRDCLVGSGEHLEYIYDFSDYWQHEIVIEKVLLKKKGRDYPLCVDGEFNRPPEHCGGPKSYRHIRRIMSDTSHPQYSLMREKIGYDLNPEFFDRKLVNQAYRNLKGYIRFFDEK